MQLNNTIKFYIWQAPKAAISALASLRVGFEHIKASKRARIVCWVILAALALTLWTLVTFRVAQRDAQQSFEAWKERFADEFISQQEAAQMGFPPDPMEELRKQENMEFAKLCAGLWRYQYGYAQFRTLGELVKLRVLNPTKPDTIVEVIQQSGQWPGYSPDNEVTADGYKMAERIMNEIRAEELPCCGSDMIIASFNKDKIVLRNTMEYGPDTETWWWGKNGEDIR